MEWREEVLVRRACVETAERRDPRTFRERPRGSHPADLLGGPNEVRPAGTANSVEEGGPGAGVQRGLDTRIRPNRTPADALLSATSVGGSPAPMRCLKRKAPPKRGERVLGSVLLSHTQVCSTIAAGGLNFCVRDGNRCTPSAVAAKKNLKEQQMHDN
jgi:hypothetical protein